MEVYIDVILMKKERSGDYIKDLRETFSTLEKYNLKLNRSKFIFGINSENFLGYLLTQEALRRIWRKPMLF